MKIVAISGSPRKNGVSNKIVDRISHTFQKNGVDVEKVFLRDNPITPCIHCDYCKRNDHCTNDEEANKVNAIMAGADAVVVVSPVYFGGVTAQCKSMMDKTLPARRNGFQLKGKVGAGITVGGSRNGGQELSLQNIHAWMLVHGMIVVGDNSHFGGTVHNPLESDDFGAGTIDGTVTAVTDMLNRLKSDH